MMTTKTTLTDKERIAILLDALRECALTFRAYEQTHWAKLPHVTNKVDAEAINQKVRANRELAIRCERAITQVTQP